MSRHFLNAEWVRRRSGAVALGRELAGSSEWLSVLALVTAVLAAVVSGLAALAGGL